MLRKLYYEGKRFRQLCMADSSQPRNRIRLPTASSVMLHRHMREAVGYGTVLSCPDSPEAAVPH
jgi:hypothetical protein